MRAPWPVLILAVILDPLLLLGEAVCHRNDTDLSAAGQRSGETSLRRRRELTFPKGSAFVVSRTAGCSRRAAKGGGEGHLLLRWTFMRVSPLALRRSRSVKSVRWGGSPHFAAILLRFYEESPLKRTRPIKIAFICATMTLSLLKAIQLNEPKNWNLDLEFDTIWPIPSQEDLRKAVSRKPFKLKRRHRRELYANLELALNSQNLPGRLCILRTICEAETVLGPPGFSIIEDAIRIVLRNFEDADNYDCYDAAYRTKNDCETVYPCPFSLLKLLLYNLYTEGT
ncbi:PREDICTED: uncharacterized protein LOC105568717 [Vollenhovia emeryi]|uniref:uncharacterized protein LOC105568717 n=1 Tax=Vollenhovia emeryi TaxID=411798 RepID=UPI0005F4C83C|nr:PREDICTED: uncharacterized protein LOC105568717 [Vollenhovia emeryi]